MDLWMKRKEEGGGGLEMGGIGREGGGEGREGEGGRGGRWVWRGEKRGEVYRIR